MGIEAWPECLLLSAQTRGHYRLLPSPLSYPLCYKLRIPCSGPAYLFARLWQYPICPQPRNFSFIDERDVIRKILEHSGLWKKSHAPPGRDFVAGGNHLLDCLEIVINLKAAKQIGFTIPSSILCRADKFIKWDRTTSEEAADQWRSTSGRLFSPVARKTQFNSSLIASWRSNAVQTQDQSGSEPNWK